MGIRFSPGPCGCCNRVLYWINNYYFQIFHPAPTYTPSSAYYSNIRQVHVDSWIQELNQINPDVIGGEYSKDIDDYNLIFWLYPTPPLPDWFYYVISSANKTPKRIIVLTDYWYYRRSDVDFYNFNIGAGGNSFITLQPVSYGPAGNPLMKSPGTAENSPLMAGLTQLIFDNNIYSPAIYAAEIITTGGTILSKAKNLIAPFQNLPWLAKFLNVSIDWVIAGNSSFLASSGSGIQTKFLDNLLDVPIT